MMSGPSSSRVSESSTPSLRLLREVVADSQIALKWRLLARLAGEPGDLLACGCGPGELSAYLARCGFRVWGLEIDEQAATTAASRSLERVVTGDVRSRDAWERLGRCYDLVLFSDVLEHLDRPATALELAREFLRPGGSVVISVPNVAFWKVRLGLLRGRWEYQDEGILDRTHLRFYTFRTCRELVEDAGYAIQRVVGLPGWVPGLSPFRAAVHGTLASVAPSVFATNILARLAPVPRQPASSRAPSR